MWWMSVPWCSVTPWRCGPCGANVVVLHQRRTYNERDTLPAMSTLILTLPDSAADAAEGYDFVLARDEGVVAESGSAPLALLPPATELVALVPVHKLSWQPVRLPRGSLGRSVFRDGGAGRLRAVLDGVLEERVLDDPA